MRIEFKYKGFIDAKLEDHEICQVRYPKGGTSVITEMGFDAANWTKDILVLLVLSFVSRLIAFAIFNFRLNKLKRKVVMHGTCTPKKISPLR
ncbi:Oidioi.mRNA.OKI2018_I69.PAR.g9341.t1.cds [Oikopleura dioica]|uniref:Oidioi.mRNA.OKI2018_I69.PAR.g9341.t1.cds n=1 Tax=Oikopleura dioica TaxID=34765 RepID=A0ABN7RKA1_OIKDI|nr:Oidioi.mRNA.OKI2018_I69.PAR.g9341.t1.cds [Oikopleura dioica]